MLNHSVKSSLLLAASLFGLCATLPAAAQTASADDSGLSEIIVTARRTEERLQDVPISISVFNQQQLSDRNIVLASDLATYTPSLSINQAYGPDKSSFAIRGFVQDQATAPSVGVYFADVTEPRAQGGTTSGGTAPPGSFVDLQNVQVLKGPQGTLFGRNTTGGAILLVPQKPTDKLEGWVESAAGDYNMWRETGVFNLPVSDTLKVRAMVDRNYRGGYMENESGIGPSAYDNINYTAARLSVLADITPNLENYTIANYSDSYSNGPAPRIEACYTTGPGLIPLVGGMACAQLARQNARGDSLLDVDVGIPDAYVRLLQWGFINTTTWKESDTLTVKNIASYTEFREHSSFSLFGDNFTVPGTTIPLQLVWLQPGLGDGNNAGSDNITEELRFQGMAADNRLTWQAGGYYEHSFPNDWSTTNTGSFASCIEPSNLNCTNPLGFGNISTPMTKTTFDTRGLYAQGTYSIIDQLSLTGGIRETWDKINALDQSTRVQLPPGGAQIRICNDVVKFPNPFNPSTGMVVTNAGQCFQDFRVVSEKPTWLVDLDYKPTQDLMAYAKYSRGYREGGINVTNVGLETWNPEKVDAYEVGAKTTFREGPVFGYFNVSAFYNNFSNQQLQATLVAKPSSGITGGAAIVNAGKSRIEGVEIDTSATVFDHLRFDLGYTYLNTKLQAIDVPTLPANSPFSQIIPSAQVGSSLALSPKNRVSVTGTYLLPLNDSIGKISFGPTLVHTDKQIISLATAPQFQDIPTTNLVNLNLNWDSVFKTPVDLGFFVTNLTNKIYPVSVGSAYFSLGFEDQDFAPPRMWGARIRYTFGR
jgi:iron complex outermembrane receptor protein